jgi:hypothetical protein
VSDDVMGWGSRGWEIKFSNHTILESHKPKPKKT